MNKNTLLKHIFVQIFRLIMFCLWHYLLKTGFSLIMLIVAIKNISIAYLKEQMKANFEYALIEYENYKILADDKTDALADKIETLKLVINPEIYFIETNIKKLEMLMYNENYEDVIEICDKIILFSSQ